MADLIFDTEGGVENKRSFLNYVKVIFHDKDGLERHVTINNDGVITDIVQHGVVRDTAFVMHEDLLDGEV